MVCVVPTRILTYSHPHPLHPLYKHHRFHRQAIMARFQDPTGELAHVAEALEEDAKNYHVWAYRSVQSVSQSVACDVEVRAIGWWLASD